MATIARKEVLQLLVNAYGPVFSRKQALALVKSKGGNIADVRFIFNNKALRAGRGNYDVSSIVAPDAQASAPAQ